MKQHSMFTWNCQIVGETLFLSRVGSCRTSALTKPFFAKAAVESTHLQHKFISNKTESIRSEEEFPTSTVLKQETKHATSQQKNTMHMFFLMPRCSVSSASLILASRWSNNRASRSFFKSPVVQDFFQRHQPELPHQKKASKCGPRAVKNKIWRISLWFLYDFFFDRKTRKTHWTLLLAPGLSHIRRRKVTSPNGNARWRKVTSHGGKSHHFVTIPMAQRHPTENQKLTKSSCDIAHSEIFVDFRKKFAPNTNGTACAIAFFQILSIPDPNGTATITQTSLDNLFWQSQWHSDCYTDFFWQFLLTIPMAQRLLHRLLLAISFDNPNGTATVTQTSFGNFFWQSQWHSDCYTDFFWQFLLTIPMAQRLLHRLLLAICRAQILLSSVWQRPPQRPNMATETRFDEEDLCRKFSCYSVTAIFFTFIPGPKTGNANESSKATQYCAQQQKW